MNGKTILDILLVASLINIFGIIVYFESLIMFAISLMVWTFFIAGVILVTANNKKWILILPMIIFPIVTVPYYVMVLRKNWGKK